ncbi:hypothetical protein [Jeotgalibacillus proteolyticus]|uniref:Uncharacterized protein n=1 Tax=Jeotgalibacillus proteolyticus TaxID=2082395 RepID=A0A2S5GDM4_9BACL|nr:hypothetical protein [Jeotgalibacillus proteolyticus]PPA71089.1 hypothetical protein C4B60_09960 [Jeotgalibacillus proteolyticus]
MRTSDNKIAVTLKVIGYITFFLTGITFFVLLANFYNDFLTVLIYTFSMFSIGMIFVGLGEVISLLQNLSNNQPELPAAHKKEHHAETEAELKLTNETVGERAKAEIEEFFAKNDKQVTDIKAMHIEDFYLVTVEGEAVTVELGGFQPVVYKKD